MKGEDSLWSFPFQFIKERRIFLKGKTALQKLGTTACSYIKSNSSTILSWLAAGGVIGTAVATGDAAVKADHAISNAEYEENRCLTTKEKAIISAKYFVFPAIMGASTITCIFGANILNKKQQAALMSAYALADGARREYRDKVKDMLGEEVDEQIQTEIIKDKVKDVYVGATGVYDNIDSLPTDGHPVLFYEEFYGRYFESTIEAVLNAEYHFNRNFSIGGVITLADFHSFLGLKPSKEAEVLGWNSWDLLEQGHSAWIDFNHKRITLKDGTECYIIEMEIPPEVGYDEY